LLHTRIQLASLLMLSKSIDLAPLNPAFSYQRAGKFDSPGLSVRLESSNQSQRTAPRRYLRALGKR
jgi:hypothetical protein